MSSPPYQSSDFLCGVWHYAPRLSPYPTQVSSSPYLGSNTTLQVNLIHGYLSILFRVWFSCIRPTVLVPSTLTRHTSLWVPLSVSLGFDKPRQSPSPRQSPNLWSYSGFDPLLPSLKTLCSPPLGFVAYARLPHPLEALALYAGHFSPSLGFICCLRVPHGWVASLPHFGCDTSTPYMDMDALLISLGLQDSMLGFSHR